MEWAKLMPGPSNSNTPRHGCNWPGTEELRERLTQKIRLAMEEESFLLIPSPTSSGKSHNGASTSWKSVEESGDAPVIHLHQTQNSRKEAVEMSKNAGVEATELLGGEEACKTVRGIFDEEIKTPTGETASEWLEDQIINRQNTLSSAHSHLEEYNGGELPCCPCPSVEQWKGIPYDENGDVAFDVVHATHNFAYVPSLVDQTNIFFDEQPDFKRTIGPRSNNNMTRSRFQDIITAWLKKIDAPVSSWEIFVAQATDGSDKLGEVLCDPPEIDPDWFITGEHAHALAPALTEAAYKALSGESDSNGRRVGRADSNITGTDGKEHDDFRYSRTRITLIIDEDNNPTVYWNVPELGNARSIICLDAWPSIHEWKQNVGEELGVEKIVSKEDFEQWRKFERGLEVVQVGSDVRPASTDFAVENYTDPEQHEIVVKSLLANYGDEFSSVIYPKAMEDQMNEILPEYVEVLTFGNVKSNNSFSDKSVGLVTNSLDPGDDYVIDLLAARDLDAEPERFECIDCQGDDCPICGGEPNRKPGRGFVGPDAEAAQQMLAGIRDNSIAQANGRWARSTDSPRAIVFVRTSAVPDRMVDTKIDSEWKFTDKQRIVIDYLREEEAPTTTTIVEATGVSKDTVHRTMSRLIDVGLATRGPDQSGTNSFRYMLTDSVPEKGILEGAYDIPTNT